MFLTLSAVMGTASSKIEEDKALLLCRERWRFVRQALDGRCSLAAAHVSYVEALRDTGSAVRKFFEPNIHAESLVTSMSITPETQMLTDRSASQFSVFSPSPSQRMEIPESDSPIPSPLGSSQVNVNHLRLRGNDTTTIEERPPISVTATLHSSDNSQDPWDYFFAIPNPIDRQLSYEDSRVLSHSSGDIGDISQVAAVEGTSRLEIDDVKPLIEVEGIPELDDEGDRSSLNGRSEVADSGDDFDQPSTETLVRRFKTRSDGSSGALPANDNSKADEENDVNHVPVSGEEEKDSHSCSEKAGALAIVCRSQMNGVCEGERSLSKGPDDDFLTCIKEIEELFTIASDSGMQVSRMLEADKVNIHIFPQGKGHKTNGSIFSTAFLCCGEEAHGNEDPAITEIRYLTWNRSMSSLSSSSRIPLGNAPPESSDFFSNTCMNSGSHASTLDRLYAWEKKLYDEVKASEIVRKDYDMKCKLLRQQEARYGNSNQIDKIRAKVKDSHSRVKVAIHRIDSISKTIEELRDQELQPQLEELLEGFSRMWVAMLDCHRRQAKIISMACTNNRTVRISVQSESHCQAAIALDHQLTFLCSSFTDWISAQKSYLQAINSWLLKCAPMVPTVQRRYSKKKVDEFCPRKYGGPPIYTTCQEWLKGLDELPTKEALDAIKSLAEQTTHFLPQQEKKHGSANLVRSLSRRLSRHDEPEGEMLKRGDSFNGSSGINSLQSHLRIYLDRMRIFSEESVRMYATIREAIDDVRGKYETMIRDEESIK